VVITVQNVKTTLIYQGLVAVSAMTMLVAVVAAGKKW
jgi:hypothetical protein